MSSANALVEVFEIPEVRRDSRTAGMFIAIRYGCLRAWNGLRVALKDGLDYGNFCAHSSRPAPDILHGECWTVANWPDWSNLAGGRRRVPGLVHVEGIEIRVLGRRLVQRERPVHEVSAGRWPLQRVRRSLTERHAQHAPCMLSTGKWTPTRRDWSKCAPPGAKLVDHCLYFAASLRIWIEPSSLFST